MGASATGVTLTNTAHDVLTVTGGSITLTPAQLAGLALVSDGETQHFDLSVTATVVDGQIPGAPLDPLRTASVTKSLHVDVTPVADTPILNVPTGISTVKPVTRSRSAFRRRLRSRTMRTLGSLS